MGTAFSIIKLWPPAKRRQRMEGSESARSCGMEMCAFCSRMQDEKLWKRMASCSWPRAAGSQFLNSCEGREIRRRAETSPVGAPRSLPRPMRIWRNSKGRVGVHPRTIAVTHFSTKDGCHLQPCGAMCAVIGHTAQVTRHLTHDRHSQLGIARLASRTDETRQQHSGSRTTGNPHSLGKHLLLREPRNYQPREMLSPPWVPVHIGRAAACVHIPHVHISYPSCFCSPVSQHRHGFGTRTLYFEGPGFLEAGRL